MKTAATAAASAFAHLKPPLRAAEGDPGETPAENPGETPRAETDDEKKKREEAERDANKAETGRAETDDERQGREETERAQNNSEDEQDEQDEGEPAARAVRRRERARCAAIFSSEFAGKNPVAAAHLAFQTALPRSQAIGMLGALCASQQAAPAPAPAAPAARDQLRDRMAAVEIPEVGASGGDAPATGVKGLADQIVAAGRKRRGET